MQQNNFLLIGRKDGSSSSRRQRRYATLDLAERAVVRWRREGFNTWWVYGPAMLWVTGGVVREVLGSRPLLRQWTDTEAGHATA